MTDKQIICKCNDKECGQCSFEEQLKAKEQEYEELDNEAQNLFTEKTNLEFEVKDLRQQLDQLKQSLTEIKEIAEKGHKEKGNLMRTWWFKDILQKISEVEE